MSERTKELTMSKDYGEALTWDDLAEEYTNRFGGTPRIMPMEKVFDRVVATGAFVVHPVEGTVHRMRADATPEGCGEDRRVRMKEPTMTEPKVLAETVNRYGAVLQLRRNQFGVPTVWQGSVPAAPGDFVEHLGYALERGDVVLLKREDADELGEMVDEELRDAVMPEPEWITHLRELQNKLKGGE